MAPLVGPVFALRCGDADAVIGRASVVLALLAAACSPAGGAPDGGASERRGGDEAVRAPVTTADSCDTLTRRQCLAATHCRLVGRAPLYECRPASGPCEAGFPQTDGAACARAGCTFRPAECYCPCMNNGRTKAGDADGEGCACACGGGPPPSCVAKGTPTDRPRR